LFPRKLKVPKNDINRAATHGDIEKFIVGASVALEQTRRKRDSCSALDATSARDGWAMFDQPRNASDYEQ